jgi:hypothetical protein
MEGEYGTFLKELTWRDVRNDLKLVNPTLAKIIDQLDPSPEYKLFKASFPFGKKIIQDGKFLVPINGQLSIPLGDKLVNAHINQQLGYNMNTNPVSVILKNSAEIFMELERERTIPLFYGLIPPGKIVSTWRVLNPKCSNAPAFLWHMTAGARSIFMLPKIAQASGFRKLRKAFNLRVEPPASLFEHWNIFREIANHSSLDEKEKWEVEILYFGKKWFESLDDKAWVFFHRYLLDEAWKSSEFWRNQFIWDMTFSFIQKKRITKINPYVADTVYHLISVGAGELPAFSAAIDDLSAPIKLLQKIFLEVYKLEEYAPIIMLPSFLSFNKETHPVYYSLQYPNTMKFAPRLRKEVSKMSELHEIERTMNTYLEELRANEMNLTGTPLHDSIQQVQFDYFHTNPENYEHIKCARKILEEDCLFKSVIQKYNGRHFPYNSAFLRGCVRIMKKA